MELAISFLNSVCYFFCSGLNILFVVFVYPLTWNIVVNVCGCSCDYGLGSMHKEGLFYPWASQMSSYGTSSYLLGMAKYLYSVFIILKTLWNVAVHRILHGLLCPLACGEVICQVYRSKAGLGLNVSWHELVRIVEGSPSWPINKPQWHDNSCQIVSVRRRMWKGQSCKKV